VADHMVDANLAGHDSHGVRFIPAYAKRVRDGSIVPDARPELVRESAATALVDGHATFGQVAARYGTEVAIRKAKAEGACVVSVVRCNHVGRVGTYPSMAASRGVALFVTVGSAGDGNVAPYGGRTGAMGTNPMAFGFPTREAPPFLVDFATSAVAGGKVHVARDKGERLAEGLLLDSAGNPTTDPRAMDAGGALLTFGGHKGYGLAMVAALFSGALTNDGGPDGAWGQGGLLILAIDTGAFGDADEIVARADRALLKVKAVPPRDGFDEVLLPGEPEVRSRERRLAEGIPIPDAIWREIGETATGLGVEVPN